MEQSMDVELIRLQYEVLNKPIAQLAQEEHLPVEVLAQEAEEAGWTQMWPPQPKKAVDDSDGPVDADELMAQETEQYIDDSRKRLRVYSLAKEILLSQRYLTLECALIEAAKTVLDTSDVGAAAVKQMSSLYKDLQANSNAQNMSSLSFGIDDNGMPTVIRRDLSGKK